MGIVKLESVLSHILALLSPYNICICTVMAFTSFHIFQFFGLLSVHSHPIRMYLFLLMCALIFRQLIFFPYIIIPLILGRILRLLLSTEWYSPFHAGATLLPQSPCHSSPIDWPQKHLLAQCFTGRQKTNKQLLLAHTNERQGKLADGLHKFFNTRLSTINTLFIFCLTLSFAKNSGTYILILYLYTIFPSCTSSYSLHFFRFVEYMCCYIRRRALWITGEKWRTSEKKMEIGKEKSKMSFWARPSTTKISYIYYVIGHFVTYLLYIYICIYEYIHEPIALALRCVIYHMRHT